MADSRTAGGRRPTPIRSWAGPPAKAWSIPRRCCSVDGPTEDFYGYWPKQTVNPFTPILNNTLKYVASRTLREPLPWSNSTLLKGDVPEAVAQLRTKAGKNVVVLGSGELVQTLLKHDLIDEYVLLIHPLVLGRGRRLFAGGGPLTRLRLADTKTTSTGVVLATYQPAEEAAAR